MKQTWRRKYKVLVYWWLELCKANGLSLAQFERSVLKTRPGLDRDKVREMILAIQAAKS